MDRLVRQAGTVFRKKNPMLDVQWGGCALQRLIAYSALQTAPGGAIISAGMLQNMCAENAEERKKKRSKTLKAQKMLETAPETAENRNLIKKYI